MMLYPTTHTCVEDKSSAVFTASTIFSRIFGSLPPRLTTTTPRISGSVFVTMSGFCEPSAAFTRIYVFCVSPSVCVRLRLSPLYSSALFSLCLSSVAYTVSPIVRSVTVTCGSLSPVIAETICAICAESALV